MFVKAECVCLVAVGGLTSPVKGAYTEPLYIVNKPPDSLQLLNSSIYNEDEEEESVEKAITAGRRTKGWNDEEDEEEEAQRGPRKLISEPNHKKDNKVTTVPELERPEVELRKLERGDVSLSVVLILSCVKRLHSADCFSWLFADFCLSSLSQLHSAEMQEQLLFPYSPWEPWDKKVTQKSHHRESLIYFTLCRSQIVGMKLINGKYG